MYEQGDEHTWACSRLGMRLAGPDYSGFLRDLVWLDHMLPYGYGISGTCILSSPISCPQPLWLRGHIVQLRATHTGDRQLMQTECISDFPYKRYWFILSIINDVLEIP